MISRRALVALPVRSEKSITMASVPPVEAAHSALNPQPGGKRDVLLCVFLRGGADGLHMLIPHSDDDYHRARPRIGMQAGGQSGVLDLDGYWGLHPKLAFFKEFWDAKQLAIINACGATVSNHSHFSAMDSVERAAPQNISDASGWLGRHLALTQELQDSPLRAIGFGALLQASLRGGNATAMTNLNSFRLQLQKLDLPKIRAAHGEIYRAAGTLAAPAQQTLSAVDLLERLNAKRYKPSDGAQYPDSGYGRRLKETAQLIKADIGLEVVCIDLGDWDTHVTQGAAEGEMAGNLSELAAGLYALYTDLSAHLDRVTIVTMSEFGRRVAENGGGGTDHGAGNLMFVLGGNINGGQIYGEWPGLHPDQLTGPGDLPVTTDYRTVLAELVAKRLQNPQLDKVFPGFAPPKWLGIAKG